MKNEQIDTAVEYLSRPQLEARVRAADHNAGVQFSAGLVLGLVIGAGLAGTILAVVAMAGAP
jgi:hypothetical protein